jgi:hypothetical protein
MNPMSEKEKIKHACKHTRMDGGVHLDENNVEMLWESADFRKWYVNCFPTEFKEDEEEEKKKAAKKDIK